MQEEEASTMNFLKWANAFGKRLVCLSLAALLDSVALRAAADSGVMSVEYSTTSGIAA